MVSYLFRKREKEMTISERIFKLLETKKMTKAELSRRTGIAATTIQDWQKKGVNPSSDKIMKLCEVLEITPYELLNGTDVPDALKQEQFVIRKGSEEYSLLETYYQCDEDERKCLSGYLQALKDKKQGSNQYSVPKD